MKVIKEQTETYPLLYKTTKPERLCDLSGLYQKQKNKINLYFYKSKP